mgnify:CR=1 FL=1
MKRAATIKTIIATINGATNPEKSAAQFAIAPDKIAIKPFPQVAHENVSERSPSSNPIFFF